MPGHTEGSLAFVVDCGGERVVFSGDAAKNRYELRTGEVKMSKNYEQSKASIEKMLQLGDSFVPGHDIWCDCIKGKITPRGRNAVCFRFPDGITMDGKQDFEIFME